ncbi:MAG: DNA-binding protein WhiA [Clostridioides sp.]|nr:DNA-binding protein WhiA [Clostridioides sp.]
MSFSTETKNELARILPDNVNVATSELSGIIKLSGTIQIVGLNKVNIKITTELNSIARKVFKLLKNTLNITTNISVNKNQALKRNNSYVLTITDEMGSIELLKTLGMIENREGFYPVNTVPQNLLFVGEGQGENVDLSEQILSENIIKKKNFSGNELNEKELDKKNKSFGDNEVEEECQNDESIKISENYKSPINYLGESRKAYIRGAFLGSGSISSPNKSYHMEFVTNSEHYANSLKELINSMGFNSKVVPRKNNYIVYLKESEQISDLLSIIGAHNALLNLQNAKVLKEMRNNVNRIVNCETANLSKIVNASVKQIEDINYIQNKIGISKLPNNLQQVAIARLEYEEMSLKELGEILDPPIGKSGVNHRLRKISEIANRLRESDVEKSI